MRYLILMALVLATAAQAGSSFGGSRSSSSSSFSSARSSSPSVSRGSGGSYFGGSRSAGSAATITRPSPPAPAARPSTSSAPGVLSSAPRTVVHETHHYQQAAPSHDGFFSGLLLGSVLNHQQPAPVVVSNGSAAPLQASPALSVAPTVTPASEGTGWIQALARILLALIMIAALAAVIYFVVRWVEDKHQW